MNSILTSRFFGLLKFCHRLQVGHPGILHQTQSFCTTPQTFLKGGRTDTSCLDKISSIVSSHFTNDNKSQSKLLIVHNPADETSIQKLKDAGVEHLYCTVESNDHLKFIKKRLKITYKNDSLYKRVYKQNWVIDNPLCYSTVEEKILDSNKGAHGNGAVFLVSFVLPSPPRSFCRSFLNYRLRNIVYSKGVYSLQNVDWFCLMSSYDMQGLTDNYVSTRFFRTFHDFKICCTMKYQDMMPLFKPIDVTTTFIKQVTKRGKKVENKIKSSDVCLVHITPNFDLIKQTTEEERHMYGEYLRHQRVYNRLIPFVEKWVPGSGRTLIHKGYGMADEIGDLPMENHLNVFKILRSIPEYENSALQTMLEHKNIELPNKRPR